MKLASHQFFILTGQKYTRCIYKK